MYLYVNEIQTSSVDSENYTINWFIRKKTRNWLANTSRTKALFMILKS